MALSFPQQVINSGKAYPCPRCPVGAIEVTGLSETFNCSDCGRHYIALCGGHYLYPAKPPGWKIMPVFWWDGFHWHRSGNTATKSQLTLMVFLSLLPALAYFLPIHLHLWNPAAAWCHSVFPVAGIAIASLAALWLGSWDFDFLSAPTYQTESNPALPHSS
jgi:hypothetical protein